MSEAERLERIRETSAALAAACAAYDAVYARAVRDVCALDAAGANLAAATAARNAAVRERATPL